MLGHLIRTVVVDDHSERRETLARTLDAVRELEVADEVGDVGGVRRLAERWSKLVAVVPLAAGEERPLGAVRGIRESCPDAKVVVVVTDAITEGRLAGCFAAGTHGVVVADAGAPGLVDAVRVVWEDLVYIDPRLGERVIDMAMQARRMAGPFGLSTQERRVLLRLSRGSSNAEIADQLSLSIHTVKSHVRSVLRKLEATDRHEAVEIASGLGLVSPPRPEG